MKENHADWETMEQSHKEIDQLLQKYIGRMYGSLEAASIEHFLKTGTINGNFRLNLVRMIFDPMLNKEQDVQVSDTTQADSSNSSDRQKTDSREERERTDYKAALNLIVGACCGVQWENEDPRKAIERIYQYAGEALLIL